MIEIYSKVGCAHCDKAKNLLKTNKVAYKEYVLGAHYTREELLRQFPDAKTMPIILVDGQQIADYFALVDIVRCKSEMKETTNAIDTDS